METSHLPSNYFSSILCVYGNATSQIQIVQLISVPNLNFKRVIFPGQRLLFKALPNAQLEIHMALIDSEISSDRITCNCLQVDEQATSVHLAN